MFNIEIIFRIVASNEYVLTKEASLVSARTMEDVA